MKGNTRRRSLLALTLTPLALAGISSGCSGETTTQGEIIVAIQTDLSLPKDVSSVRIQISTLGVVRFDNTYPVGPDPSMRIPATLGVLPGDNPDTPVRIRVVGFKKEFQPRILREVVTTVPPSRVVSLRMPLQWLSDGSAHTDPLSSGDPNAFINACDEGTTSIGGLCEPSTIRSATLPDYAPADIFGGGDDTGAGGTCFDTQPCMQGRVVTQATTQADGSCVMSAAGGDPSLVNVAVEFAAGGDGICADAKGSGPCFVPLDRVDAGSEGLGWYADAASGAGAIRLPRGLCTKLQAPGFAGHLVVSQTCASKTQANPPCGPWSSVQSSGGKSSGDASAPPDATVADADTGNDVVIVSNVQRLATGQPGASALTLDSSDATSGDVLWTVAGAGLRYISKSGVGGVHDGQPPFTSTSVNAFHMAHDATGLVDLSGVGTDSFQGILWQYASVDAGAGSFVATRTGESTPRGVAVLGNQAVWATNAGVHACDVTNCASTFNDLGPPLAGAPNQPFDVAIDASSQTFYATNGDSFIYSCPVSGCDGFGQIAQNPGQGGNNLAILTTPFGIFWIDEASPGSANGHVYMLPFVSPDGGTASVVALASNIDTGALAAEVHRGLAVDQNYVYFAAGGGVFAAPINGAPMVQVAGGMPKPTAVAVDSGFVYWSDFSDGTISRAPKPGAPPPKP